MTQDPYRFFRIEARELSEQMGQLVLELEGGPPDPDAVTRLLRLAHTLKGAARVVQQIGIADRAHAIEELLAGYRDSDRALSVEAAGELLGHLDVINAGVAALDAPPSSPAGPASAAPDPTPADGPSVEALAAGRADAADVDELLDAIGETQEQFAPVWRALDALEAIRQDLGHGVGSALGDGRLRALADRVGAAGRALTRSLERTERCLSEVRARGESLRLVPAGAIFAPLRRAVRDVARVQGKSVEFACSGGEIRIDPHVLSTVHGAMLHAVRNAVAHGIEAEAERRARGKPVTGQVSLTVARRGTRVAFVCRDDGQGFDLEAVRAAAHLTGMSPADTAGLDADALMALALTPGVSTSTTVTEVSGRGIGLDVVRDVATQLGGEVRVSTDPGVGAAVELEVPLSLLAVDGLLADVAGTTVTIPLDAVRHSMRLTPADIVGSPAPTVTYHGRAVPFLPLARMLRPSAASAQRTVVAVVVAADDAEAAVGVDRLLGTASVVVQGLPELARAGEFVSGLAVDLDGSARLVLDPPGLIRRARRGVGAGPDPADGQRRRKSILVVDDSLTTRMLERNILEAAGYDVDVAGSGEEGLEKARSRRFALFLVDIEMPGMDGFTFVERTRADPQLRDIPSILVSSRASQQDRERGRRAGARTHVDKSEFDQKQLLSSIEALVG